MDKNDPHYQVHITHCCVYSCKYGDEDCPCATGQELPQYNCEDCSCPQLNPGIEAKAEAWWAKLTPGDKASIYHWNKEQADE